MVDQSEGRGYQPSDEIIERVHPHHWHRAARALDDVPMRIKPTVLGAYEGVLNDAGEDAALECLGDIREAWGGGALSISATDDDIRQYAEMVSKWVHDRLYRHAHLMDDDFRADGPFSPLSGRMVVVDRTVGGIRRWIGELLRGYGIAMPGAMLGGLIARVTSARWWARKLRVVVMRRLEAAAIRAGMVHIRAGVYVSDETAVRRGRAARKSAAEMQQAVATNERGDEYTLAELAALGVSNPEVRRAEMMTRIRGVEEAANARAWSAYFATLTCPSLFHARSSRGGVPNPAYEKATPKDAQAWLTGQWAKARAKLARAGIDMMGMRVAEPHHDGTPHWHVLIFCRAEDAEVVHAVLRKYWMELAPDEIGADRHRMAWEVIDYRRGSAVGYVAKYIAKAIDGHAVEEDIDTAPGGDTETGLTAIDGAQRVRAWSATWGIRQFQFFGVPSVGPWRELRRVRDLGPKQLDFFEAWQATKPKDQDGRADWKGYMDAVRKRPISMLKECRESAYPGESIQAVIGVVTGEQQIITRVHVWEVNWNASKGKGKQVWNLGGDGAVGAESPWTRVNNCTEGQENGRDGTARRSVHAALTGGEDRRRADVCQGRGGRSRHEATDRAVGRDHRSHGGG
jgi:hypothetical protein